VSSRLFFASLAFVHHNALSQGVVLSLEQLGSEMVALVQSLIVKLDKDIDMLLQALEKLVAGLFKLVAKLYARITLVLLVQIPFVGLSPSCRFSSSSASQAARPHADHQGRPWLSSTSLYRTHTRTRQYCTMPCIAIL
jgi:hypothetical protein